MTLLLLALPGFFCEAAAERDPHRPPCTTQSCKTIKRFVKARYCGESPFGNGPDDGCEIRHPIHNENVRVIADYRCDWNERTQSSNCRVRREAPVQIVAALRRELLRLGLSKAADKDVHIRVWTPASGRFKLAQASYDQVKGLKLTLCDIIVVFADPTAMHIVREVRCHTTDADVPTGTTWTPIDITAVDGSESIVLEGDSYEDHWLEVVKVGDDLSTNTVFSGLGYYL